MSIADAVLYEGSLLYPYRPSALKNRHRYPFGTLYPDEFCRAHDAGDAASLRLECVVLGPPEARLEIQLRFLEIGDRDIARAVQPRAVTLNAVARAVSVTEFAIGAVRGAIATRAIQRRAGVWTLTVRVSNHTAFARAGDRQREDALRHALASPHLLLSVTGAGAFVSLIDPPAELRDVCAACRSAGTWPVLLGAPGTADTLLAAPIILYDHPHIAPESPGDFFDATEIDELLTLRVLTLSEAEKAEIRATGGPGARLLERTEAAGLESLRGLHAGACVRLRPRGRADVFDLALDGKRATVQAVEHDYEGRVHVAVTLDDDPGRDLAAYGHRFFFRPDDLEIL